LINRDEVLVKHGDKWLHFSHPYEILQTQNISEVRGILDQTENLVNVNNWHAAGFVSYEAAPAFDQAAQTLNSVDFPLIWFGLYPEPFVIELPKPQVNTITMDWKPDIDQASYNAAIERIRHAIAKGLTYQVNFTMRLKAEFDGNAWELFLQIARGQNKYAAYLDIGNQIICSASPELFFELNGDELTCRPMKGTAQRGKTTEEDTDQSKWLRASSKNQAENVMIVDMIRNDLGKIAGLGSVHVSDLFKIEKYPTLFQMTSTVKAKSKQPLADIFSALFPCASITGAPKFSTMKIISELESSPRKIYTGSIGYIAPNRKAQFNVAIRTIVVNKEERKAEYGVGGGIVWDSDNQEEYNEAILKAQILSSNQVNDFSLFETILWTPESGYFLLDRHIARLTDSADYFDFPFSKLNLEKLLGYISLNFKTQKRVKVLLNSKGAVAHSAIDFRAEDRIYKVYLADSPVNINNKFLYHKTTRREHYLLPKESAADTLLYNENNELTEFAIGNLVVNMHNELFTPPISCGLLPGTFRADLLESGRIKERIIHKSELDICSSIYLINSLRKWMEVNIIMD